MRDLRGVLIDQPRVFYRGTNPGDTRRIKTGDDHWDAKLFLSSNRHSASAYGSEIATYDADPTANILYDGTSAYRSIAKGLKGNLLVVSSAVVARAAQAGYDAVWFVRQGDVGTAVINPAKFHKREPVTESVESSDFQFVKPSHSAGYTPVWIDIAKFDPYFARDTGFYIGTGGSGSAIAGRYERFENWLRQGKPIEMPEVGLSEDGLRATFGNGRHRYAVLRDMGIRRMPVMVAHEDVQRFKKLFS